MIFELQKKVSAVTTLDSLWVLSLQIGEGYFPHQGDQIGEIYASWVIVFFGQFFVTLLFGPF
jgi:hypothetical protein